MKKEDMSKMFKKAKEENGLCRMFFKYDPNYFYYLPIEYNKKFFYGVEEDDFITDGFSIRKISDLKKVELRDDKCVEFLKMENTFANINAPQINLASWKTVFESLQKIVKYIIVRKENLDDNETDFAIGRITKATKSSLEMKYFDADGEWSDIIIPYIGITSVTLQSRYVAVWEKYLE